MIITDIEKYTDGTTAGKIIGVLSNNMNFNTVKADIPRTYDYKGFEIHGAMVVLRDLTLTTTSPKNFDKYYEYLQIIKKMIKEGEK